MSSGYMLSLRDAYADEIRRGNQERANRIQEEYWRLQSAYGAGGAYCIPTAHLSTSEIEEDCDEEEEKPKPIKKKTPTVYCKRCGEKLVVSDLKTHYDETTGKTLGVKIMGCPNNKSWFGWGHSRFKQDKYGDWVRRETNWNKAGVWLSNIGAIVLMFGLLGLLCYLVYYSTIS